MQPLSNYLATSSGTDSNLPNVYRPLTTARPAVITTPTNPFLTSTASVPTPTPLPFSDPIYRPKRGKKKRPSPRPSFFHTTVKPSKGQLKQKDRDFEKVKAAFLNYYQKAKDYTKKYREKVDTKAFKLELVGGKKKRNSIGKTENHRRRPPLPTPGPFSGKTRLQKPFRTPLFTLPNLSTPKPHRPPQPFQPGMRRKNTEKSIDLLHAKPRNEMSYDGILTPPSIVDNDKSYTYYDEDYYFYNDHQM